MTTARQLEDAVGDCLIEVVGKRGELVIYTGLAYPLDGDGEPIEDDDVDLVPMREDD